MQKERLYIYIYIYLYIYNCKYKYKDRYIYCVLNAGNGAPQVTRRHPAPPLMVGIAEGRGILGQYI